MIAVSSYHYFVDRCFEIIHSRCMSPVCHLLQVAFIRDERIKRCDFTVIKHPILHSVLLHDAKQMLAGGFDLALKALWLVCSTRACQVARQCQYIGDSTSAALCASMTTFVW
mgnify:CR=1 FL=1